MTGDHDQPYAPVIFPPMIVPRMQADALPRLIAALKASHGRPVMVLGAPMRILMPADPNPFPTMTLWGRRGR